MTNRDPEGDGAAELLERRWFAAFKAASNVRAECEDLLDEMQRSEQAWNDARVRLSELEALRDALGEALAELEAVDAASAARAPMMSAA
jgi:hypothetical protein